MTEQLHRQITAHTKKTPIKIPTPKSLHKRTHRIIPALVILSILKQCYHTT